MTNSANDPSPTKHELGLCDRTIAIATMHHKEKVIAPILEIELGVKAIVPSGFDTDRFGTFTRDIDRMGSQIEAARHKAQAALLLTGENLAIASEGIFIPHPSLPAIPFNRELVLLIDLSQQIEVVGIEDSIETNFSHKRIRDFSEAQEFADLIGFPEHALVLVESNHTILKGVLDIAQLQELVEAAIKRSPNGTVHLETDMRALYNPTRMKNIALATWDLVKKIENLCPNCRAFGFTAIESKAGLPCGLCGLPTKLARSQVYKCQKCDFNQVVPFPNGTEFADPQYCDYCNP
jgi:hypothetical protein